MLEVRMEKCVTYFTLLVLTSPAVLSWPHTPDIYSGMASEFPAVCGGDISVESTVTVSSPGFPDNYPSGVDCRWTVNTANGGNINVTSQYFSVEEQKECLWDYLEINEQNAEGNITGRRYCGYEPFVYESVSQVIYLYFHSDDTGQGAGFRLMLQVLPLEHAERSCNQSLVGPLGYFTSPNYPIKYYPDDLCAYLIQVSDGDQIEVIFDSFDVETSPCDFDKLVIYDGPNAAARLLKVVCGRHVPEPITSSGSSMFVLFSSDHNTQTTGFNATYRALTSTTIWTTTATTQTDISNCDVVVTDTTGNISSPGFPGNYGNNQRCVTTIRAENISTITIEFTEFSVETSENCTYDSLTIKPDLTSSNDSDIDDVVLCGNDLLMTLYTFQTTRVQLVFTSDRSINKPGYLATYYITPPMEDTCTVQCDNGGECVRGNTTELSWTCDCPRGFGGDVCEFDYRDTCYTHECKNGGGCIMKEGRLECHCPDGYTGTSCEKRVQLTEQRESEIFSKFPKNTTLAMGSSVLLECAVHDPTADVMWLHKERILSEGDRSSGIEVHPGGVIHIPDVTEDQEGKYTCVAIFSKELHEVSAWIKLIQPCKLPVVIAPRNVTVAEGYSALFQCFVPDADVIVWRKDGELLRLDKRKRVLVNNYLRVEKIIETDSGEYTCAARGRNGCYARISAFMDVKTKGHDGACGRPHLVDDSVNMRISSGRESPTGAAPWHVIIREKELGVTYCGGSLITDRWVMTAAHCVFRFKDIFKTDFRKDNVDLYLGTKHCRGEGGVHRSLKNYIIHPRFNGSFHNNDIVLFELDRPVVFNDVILPICLEKLPFVEELLKSGRLGMVTGCGQLYEDGRSPLYLNEVRIPYVNRNECNRRVVAIPDAQFTESMICAGYQRSMHGDACAGDSGGAFVMEYHGRWIQVGIVSWGVGCDRQNQYGYYTHVGKFYDWIIKTVSKS
ncbi:uncharacterized protein LOC121391255 [Gigantopelta aegis]|uniref:uncharacterized protein LOC121391255 n=1 Tax=Gigantopelta aegis TaxID=1735272 RepID=UPI001B889399|nr:uncharacterized protein LOC121391255 [Gigantopelta aegis]